MPKYGLNKYSRFKYGKYILSRSGGGGNFELGPHVRYRIRNIKHDGTYSEYLTMCKDRISITGNHPRVRLRTNNNEDWTYTQQEVIYKDIFKARVRSIGKDNNPGEWVYSDKGTLS